MMNDPRWRDALSHLPDYLGSHLRVSFAALALGLLISLPLALVARDRPWLRAALLGIASVVQTIPGLALLALFYPVLLALSALLLQSVGLSFSAFGFLPSVLALALYSMLPVLRNTITGLNGIDGVLRDAAKSAGMTPRQSLTIVELPLALPVIMAGIRTAAVWVIGTATLATPIGQTSLGNYIFAGLQTQNWVYVIFGCVAAAALALSVDQLLALIESGLARRSRLRTLLGLVGVVALIAAATAPLATFVPDRTPEAPQADPASPAPPDKPYVIGAKTFTEQYVLSQLIAQRLAAAGLEAKTREGLGSGVIFDALKSNEIDVYVDYSGTLWVNQLQQTDTKPRQQLLDELKTSLAQQKVTLLGGLGFENAYALLMTRKRAAQLGIRSVTDLAARSSRLIVAGDYEFFARPEWASLQKAYGTKFMAERQMQSDFMYPAVAAGEVDVIAGYTSDGLIAKYDLVTLDEPRRVFPPYDAIVLLSPRRAGDVALHDALTPLLGAIDVAAMREANLRAGSDGGSTQDVARWLWDKAGKNQKDEKNQSPLMKPASISWRLKRRASAPSLQP